MNTPDTRERRCDGRQCDGAEGVSMPSPASTRNDPRERGGCVLPGVAMREGRDKGFSRVSRWANSHCGHCRFRFKVSYDTITHVNLDGQSSFLTKLTRAPRRGRAAAGPRGSTGTSEAHRRVPRARPGVSRTSTSRVPARRDALALLTSRTCSGSVGGSRCVRYH